jgi:CO/xanthine dehydrogenase Mo-binding subunit
MESVTVEIAQPLGVAGDVRERLHLVSVEIDPETAQVKIDGYWIADDCGVRLNPANGEGATRATPAAILCAINDALTPRGVRATKTPASPQRLWTLLQQAKPNR